MPEEAVTEEVMMEKKEEKTDEPKVEMITVSIMGKEHEVPRGLTIMKAMEYAGYQLVRGVGCRAGFCGACATIYRMKDDYKFYTALACQATAEDGMFLAQLPTTPANRAAFEIEETKAEKNTLVALYPEIARCVSCNTCTKACPQELEVMEYIQAGLRGDYELTTKLSFDCIQCGLCTARCPAEIQHYHMAQLARRLTSKYIVPDSEFVKVRITELEKGKYVKDIAAMKKMNLKQLKKKYTDRKKEG